MHCISSNISYREYQLARLPSGGKERRDNVTRLVHHHDLDTNATWQIGYIFPSPRGRILHPREEAGNVARPFFRDVPGILNAGCQYRGWVCLWRKQVSKPIRVLRDGNNLVRWNEFLKALLYSIIRVVIRQKSECKHSNKVFQWIFSGDSNRRDIENGIVYFGWEWRGGGCFFASRFKMRRCILSIVQDIGAPIGEDRKKGLIMDRMMEMLLCFCYFLRIIFVILLPSIISYQ